MKRALTLLIALTLLFTLSACGEKEIIQDESPVTMFIAMGNSESYYRQLAEKIKTELDIEVEFVYNVNSDTTDYIRLCFENNALPADIVFTSAKTDDSLLEESCLDLMSKSSVTALFTPTTVRGCTTEEGKVFQLPVSTKLIGITYNETLLKEMGWEVPETFEDMLALKASCDEAGIKFAVSDGVATGHGFNWLFHLMGSQWLSTFDGTQWLEDFQAGKTSVQDFKSQCDYFKRWTEAGLWGSFHYEDWNGGTEFSRTRALFLFSLTNSLTGYQGPEYDDEGNETGRQLNDTYKTMPWISEDGGNNCYTVYDNCWVYVNKYLEGPEESEKLRKVLSIVEYLASDGATELVNSMAKDTYVSVNNYQMGEDRLYANYSEQIKAGFVQPWYYNDFDMDSIVYTGEKVNNYIKGEGSYDEIFTTLESCNDNMLASQIAVLADFPEGLGYEDTAKLDALGCAAALDKTLEENGRSERTEVALCPYTPGDNLLQPWKGAAVSNSVVFKGSFDASMVLALVPQSGNNPEGVYMTGAEIKAIVEKGFDPSDRFLDKETGETTFDAENYGPYPYVCLVKGGEELQDDKEYLVALSENFLPQATQTALIEAGKVLTGLENAHTLAEGLKLYAESHPQITPADLTF